MGPSVAFRSLRVPFLLAALWGGARPVCAQVWLPPARQAIVSVVYQNMLAPDHLDSDGNKIKTGTRRGTIRGHSLSVNSEFGLTSRWALSVGVPFVASKYSGPYPHLATARGVDDGRYHGGVQDFRFGLRYQAPTAAVALTTSVEGIVPSHHYPAVAHNAIGKDLRGVAVGLTVGGLLDPLLELGYFQVHYSYTVVEEVERVRPNRTRLATEFGYFVTDRLGLSLLQNLDWTHEGLDFPEDYAGAHYVEHFRPVHDRISKERLLTLGAGVTFAAGRSWDVFGSIHTSLWGQNSHTMRTISFGVSRYFRLGRAPGPPTGSAAAAHRFRARQAARFR